MARNQGLIILVAVIAHVLCVEAGAQQKALTFQYRFRRDSIPAATNDEPRAKRFSSKVAKKHLETAVELWSKQQKCVSCHTHGIYMQVRPALSRFWGEPDEATRDFVVSQARELQESEDRSGSVPVQMAYIARGLAAWDAELTERTSPETDAALQFAFEMQADDPRIKRAVEWLLSNQRESGRWWTRSLNTTSRFHFIAYSGTAYAALALAKCNALTPTAD